MLKKAALFLIIALYLLLGFLYARLTPVWQAPDEPAHFNFARYIAQNRSLPELTADCYDQEYLDQLRGEKFPARLSIEGVCYEHYQPPLFYLLAAPVYALTGGNVLALRLLSVLLGAVSLFIIHQTISLFLAGTIFPLATTAFAAFVPMHLTMTALVNNDSLAELLYLLLIYLLLHWLFKQAKKGTPAPIIAGVVLGLILLTKVTVYTALITAGFILFLAKREFSTLLKNGMRIYLPALFIALPLYIRNAMLYSKLDILGLARHDAVVVGQPRTFSRIAGSGLLNYFNDLARTTFHSFWGQFGWMAVPMDGRVYLALLLATLAALLGLALWLANYFRQPKANSAVGGQRSPTVSQGLAVMLVILLLTLGVFIGLNISFVQFQGRYFFTALMPLGLFFSIGLFEASQRRNATRTTMLMGLVLLVVAVTSVQQGSLDKWAILISGGAAGLFFIRRWLPEEAAVWFTAGFYIALAGLAGLSVWWFIMPNL